MKAYLKERIERRKIHQENVKQMPPETHRVAGWSELCIHVGHSRERINTWIKLHGFPKPSFHYRQKSDATNRRENETVRRLNVWRRVAVWDKREIGDWFAARKNS